MGEEYKHITIMTKNIYKMIINIFK